MVQIKIGNTLGSLLAGSLIAAALYGITLIQTYIFFARKSKDTVRFKAMVGFLWTLNTVASILNGHFLYVYLAMNDAKPASISKLVWSASAHVMVTGVSDFVIRTMFIHRLWLLSDGNKWLAGLLVGTSIADLVTGLVVAGKASQLTNFGPLSALKPLFYASLGSGTISNLLVTLSLCYYLWRSHAGFQGADTVIQSLMKYVVKTGLLVVIDAAAGMIALAAMPHNYIFLVFYLLLSKVYLASYLTVINARAWRRKRLNPISTNPPQVLCNNLHAPELARPSLSLPVLDQPLRA